MDALAPSRRRGVIAALRAGRIALLCFAVTIVALSLGRDRAAAHAFLDTSDPVANTVMRAWPPQITMRFTEPLEHASTRAGLYDQNGTAINGTSFAFADNDPNTLTLTVPSNLPNGTYTVVYHTLSAADGHPADGYFAFTIGTQADVANVIPPPTVGDPGPPQWLKSVSRWVPLLGLALCVAVWPIWLLVLRPGISPAWQAGPALSRRVWRMATAGIVVSVLGNLLALVVQADGARDGGSLIDAVETTLTETRYGRLWVYRVGLLLVFAVVLTFCAWWRPRRRRVAATATLLLAASLPIPFSLISHASAQPVGRTSAIAFDVVHLLGASIWVGGLMLLVGALLPTLRDLTPEGRQVVLARAVPRFSAVALAAWGALGITGLYSAWLQVGNLDGLRDTAYGRSLSLKLILLAPVLLLAAFNLLIVSGRMKRAVSARMSARWSLRFAVAIAAELVIVVAVLFIVGRLTSQAPARETLAQQASQVSLPLQPSGQERTGTLTIGPAVTGPNHYRVDVTGDPLPPDTEGLLRLTPPGIQAGQKEVTMIRIGSNSFEAHGSELSLTGDWQIQVIVRKIGELQWQASTSIPITATAATDGLPRPAWRFTTSSGLSGLVLLVGGLAALALAFSAGRTPLRRESAGLGVVAIAVAGMLLIQGRTTADGTDLALTASSPIPADQASVTRGAELFAANCIACHGVGGRGDGPAAGNLDPPYPLPADFLTAHARAHFDGEFFNWIKGGKLNTAMPAFGDQLSDDDIWNVINYIRWLQQNPGQTSPAASPQASPAAAPASSPAAATPTMMPMDHER